LVTKIIFSNLDWDENKDSLLLFKFPIISS